MKWSARLTVGLLLLGLLRIVAAAPAPPQPASTVPSLFDPARHMRVSEVRPGMKGYGLSVFSGTKIERFDVEVISVLRNFNPKSDVVLIKCRGQNLEQTGAVAGMSWSPVEAFGWPNPRFLQQPAAAALTSGINRLTAESVKLQPLATPLMAGGVSQKILDQFAPLFAAQGLVSLQAGGAGGSGKPNADASITPGSVLAVPLLTGDTDMTAIGTCTEVIGDRVFCFGHPFQNEGSVVLPMG